MVATERLGRVTGRVETSGQSPHNPKKSSKKALHKSAKKVKKGAAKVEDKTK
jgi:hypothetical protein